jgi:lysophospholipase L1-like esterase
LYDEEAFREEIYMKTLKKLSALFLALLLAAGLCIVPAGAADTPIVLDNATAAVTDAGYDKDSGFVTGLKTTGTSKVVYSCDSAVNGNYDIYLEVSRQTMGFGTTPFGISVNDGKQSVPIIEYQWCKPDKSDIYEKGVFLCLKNVALKSADKITVTALSGFGFGASSFAPYIGDILLYNAGAKVPVGYGTGTLPPEQVKDPADPLSGLTLIWVGSSVAYGQQAQGWSMADYLEEAHKGLVSYKYCVSGTTLVDESPTSYISRMKLISPDIKPDFLIVQLSTNDAAMNKPFGKLSDSRELKDFDTKTIYGGLEYIVAYAAKTWNCPVVFFTGTYYDGKSYNNDGTQYGKTVEALLAVQKKWGINVIDLYNNKAMKEAYQTDLWKQYMSDGVHPKKEGYQSWWGPKFEEALTSYLKGGAPAAPTPQPDNAPADTGNHTVARSGQTVKVNGAATAFDVYNIDGSNYFKLRDIAFVLNKTGSQFSVSYDETKKVISCTTGIAYTPVGGELTAGADQSATAVPSSQRLVINGKDASLTAFNIGGSTFIKLRDLGAALNFTVIYDEAEKTILIKSAD